MPNIATISTREDLTVDTATGKTLSDVSKTRQSYGVYAEGDVELLKQLHLNAGGRYDQYGDFQPAWDPRVALIYDPFEKSTFKAIYGTAFRAPNFLELSDPRFQNISPENITSYELVYEQGIGRNLRSTVSGFYNKMDDLIVFQNGKYSNINAESQGVELGLEGNWAWGLRGRASYTLQDAENDVPLPARASRIRQSNSLNSISVSQFMNKKSSPAWNSSTRALAVRIIRPQPGKLFPAWTWMATTW